MNENMEMKETIIMEENKMGVMPVKKLVLNMALPMMFSMLVQALYNITDSMFVARYSENAFTAVTLAFPLQMLLIAVGAGTGVGMNALLSKALGEKNYKRVNASAANGLFLYVLSWLAFLVMSFFVIKPFLAGQIKNASNEVSATSMETLAEIADMGHSYLFVIMFCSLGLFLQMYFERLLASTGKTKYSMVCQLVGAITNIILDPIMIFGLLGCPSMGIAGAAIATVIGQFFAACTGCFFHFKKNKEVILSMKGFRPDAHIIGTIYKVGVPSIVMQSVGSIMNYLMNGLLMGFNPTAAAVFGAYFKLQSFFFMPIFGMNNGIAPIIAYSYGAGQRKRMIKTIKFSLAVSAAIMLVGFIAFEAVPDMLLGIIAGSENAGTMLEIGNYALRVIGIHFLIAWFCIIIGTVFQALGKAVYSLIVSVMRQLVVLVPAAYILAKMFGLKGVWWSFPIAEIMSFIVTTVCFISIYNTIIKKLPEGRE